MKYYIYLKQFSGEYYNDKNDKCKWYESRWNEFALSKNEGKQCEKGYFCGGASWYGFSSCEVIAESNTIYNFEETDEEVICNCKYVVERIKPTVKNIEDGAAWRYDQNKKDWHTFEAENDDEAFEYFKKFCLENTENEEI